MDKLESLIQRQLDELDAKRRGEREQAKRDQEKQRLERQLADALQLRVGGPLRTLLNQYSETRYVKLFRLAYGEDGQGRIWVEFERREGRGKCPSGRLEFSVGDDRSVRITTSGKGLPGTADSVALDTATTAVVTEHFKKFLEAALA